MSLRPSDMGEQPAKFTLSRSSFCDDAMYHLKEDMRRIGENLEGIKQVIDDRLDNDIPAVYTAPGISVPHPAAVRLGGQAVDFWKSFTTAAHRCRMCQNELEQSANIFRIVPKIREARKEIKALSVEIAEVLNSDAIPKADAELLRQATINMERNARHIAIILKEYAGIDLTSHTGRGK